MADYSVVFIDPFLAVTYDEANITVLDESNGMFIEVAQEETTPPDPGDTTPPVVTFVSPVEGTLLDPADALIVDVTDDSGSLGRVMVVAVNQDTAEQELAFDGSTFTARFLALSTQTSITNGYRFSLRRTGGWPAGADITIRVFAVDPSGNLES